MAEAPILLGIKDKIVALTLEGRNPVLKKEWIAAVTSWPMRHHAALKKPAVSPYGPGALLMFSLKMVEVMSSVVGKAAKS